MDKTFAGLLGAVGAVVAGTMAQATPVDPVLQANSYADLLRPIPNAVATLKALDERESAAARDAELAQYYPYYYAPRPPPGYYEHHHHHHQRYRQPPRYHHHHHHHHHHRYDDRDRF